jgi:hypothetical protein
MATITTRAGKGSPLTNNEVDANFTNLNTDKLEVGDLSVSTGAASGGGTLSYSAGVFTFAPADLSSYITDLSSFTTTDLTEGTNLYYTDSRARASLSASGDLSYNSGTGAFSVTTYKSADFDTDFTAKDTGELTEGANLYYTDTRAQAAISVTDAGGDGSLSYSSGVITYTGPSATEVRAHFSGGTGVSITSGSIAIGQAVGTTDNVTFGDVSVSGDLTVNGTTTTVNSTTVTIDDPIFTLGGDTAPASDDNKDRGIEFRWHNGSAAKVGFFGYDDSASAFTFIPDATNTAEVFSGAVGDVIFGGATVSGITLGATAITATGAEINYLSGVSGAIQTQLDAKVETLSDLSITATATEINYTSGVTSSIQNQLDAKAETLGDLGVTATSTELNYASGVTSAIQTQLDGKEPADATILKDADIGSSVLAYDSNLQGFVTAFTIPNTDGASGQALLTNGAGVIAFGDVDALPAQTGNSGKYLTTDGTSPSWDSIVVADISDLTATATELNYTDGVTSNVQTQLDAKQALDQRLTDISGLAHSDGNFIVSDGTNFVLESGATARTSLGLSIGTDVQAYDANIVSDANLASFATAFTVPTSDGTSGQALVTDGSGTIAFAGVNATQLGSKTPAYYDDRTINALGSVSGTTDIDLADGTNVTATIAGATTFTISGITSGSVNTVTLYLTNAGAYTITWPSGTTFNRNAAPVLPASGDTIIVLETYDNATSFAGIQVWRSV